MSNKLQIDFFANDDQFFAAMSKQIGKQKDLEKAVKKVGKAQDKVGKSQNKVADSAKKMGAAQEKATGSGVVARLRNMAGGYASLGGGIAVVTAALQQMKTANEKALESLKGTQDGTKRLAQIAESPADLRQLITRSDTLAQNFGIERNAARQLLFSARSEGFEESVESVARLQPLLVDLAPAAQVAGQVPKLFLSDPLTPQQALNATFVAARKSRLDFGEIARALPRASEGAALSGASTDETLATLSVLAGRFSSGKTAADRIKALATRFSIDEDFAGGGILGGVEKLSGFSPERRKKFLGQSQELNVAFRVISEEMDTIRTRQSAIQQARRRAGTPESAISKALAAVASIDEFQSIESQRKAEIRGQIISTGRGAKAADVKASQASVIADLETTGTDNFTIAAAGGAGALIGGFTNNDTAAAITTRAAAAISPAALLNPKVGLENLEALGTEIFRAFGLQTAATEKQTAVIEQQTIRQPLNGAQAQLNTNDE